MKVSSTSKPVYLQCAFITGLDLINGTPARDAFWIDAAHELASTGAKVLHQRCLGPVAKHGIPIMVRTRTLGRCRQIDELGVVHRPV